MISPKLREILSSAWTGNKPKKMILEIVVLGVIIQIGMFTLARLTGYDNLSTLIWSVAEPTTGLTTLLVVIAVFYRELEQDWENSLPKSLTVNFEYKEKLVLRCEDAFLAGEADIRQWGQQIGKQMAENENLFFLPNIKQILPSTDKKDERDVSEVRKKRYEVIFTLTKLPTSVDEFYKNGEYLLRRPLLFKNEPKTLSEKKS